MQLPERFTSEMQKMLQDEYPAFLNSYTQKPKSGLRVNTSKISVTEFLKITTFQLEAIPWVENGFFYDENDSVTKHPHYHAGLYYVQEPSAMVPASRLPVEQGDCILDLCAAPGGKATELAAKLNRSGLLVANDISASRSKGLLKNLEIFGAGNILVTSEEPGKLANIFPDFFDKILVDAPCSGEGMFRKDSSLIKDWESKGPAFYAEIQASILNAAAKMLKPGGMLLFSTCTFSELENENSIGAFLREHANFHLIVPNTYQEFANGRELQAYPRDSFKDCIRIWPHKMPAEGHFAALMKKDGTCPYKPLAKTQKLQKMPKEVFDFIHAYLKLSISEDSLFYHQDHVYLLGDEMRPLPKLRMLRTGLYLGECKKGRFEPSQALAMYLRMEEAVQYINLSSTDGRVIRYLKGETLELIGAEEALYGKGWILVCTDGFPLGWGKGVNGTIRNKYYAGWRMQ